MIIRHHHDNWVFHIEVPPGSRLRRSEAAGESAVFVPDGRGGEVPVFEEPTELLVRLAEMGKYGLKIVKIEERPGS